MAVIPLVVAFVVLPTALLRGVVFGGVVVGVPMFLWSWIVQVTGTAPIMMGDQAEQDLGVTPVVVLWGGNTREWEVSHQVTWYDDVCVVTGQALQRWRQAMPAEHVTVERTSQAWRAIADHAQCRDSAERKRVAPPRSPAQMIGSSFQALLAAVVTVYLLAQLLSLADSAVLTGVTALGATLLALLLVRAGVRSPILWGVASGSGLLGTALLGATAFEALLG